MKVTLVAKNIELTPALKDMVEKKVSKLDKYFEGNVEAKATLTVQKNRHRFEIIIPFNGVLLRAEEVTDDMYKSIDKAEEKLVRQIVKQKTKLSKRVNNQIKFSEIATDNFDEGYQGELVKTKKFAVKPMNVDEAILQMELIGHNFFVYKDSATHNISVLYKRKDGNYGLLEHEYV